MRALVIGVTGTVCVCASDLRRRVSTQDDGSTLTESPTISRVTNLLLGSWAHPLPKWDRRRTDQDLSRLVPEGQVCAACNTADQNDITDRV